MEALETRSTRFDPVHTNLYFIKVFAYGFLKKRTIKTVVLSCFFHCHRCYAIDGGGAGMIFFAVAHMFDASPL